METPPKSTDANGQQKEFSIQRIYLKDSSFEAPSTPDVFRTEWKPDMSLEIQTASQALAENVFEVVLTTTVTVKSENKPVFVHEVKYAGIFTVQGFSDKECHAILGTVAPSVLFPYVRECVSDTVSRASFPQLLLAPVNFDALYAQQMQDSEAGSPVTN